MWLLPGAEDLPVTVHRTFFLLVPVLAASLSCVVRQDGLQVAGAQTRVMVEVPLPPHLRDALNPRALADAPGVLTDYQAQLRALFGRIPNFRLEGTVVLAWEISGAPADGRVVPTGALACGNVENASVPWFTSIGTTGERSASTEGVRYWADLPITLGGDGRGAGPGRGGRHIASVDVSAEGVLVAVVDLGLDSTHRRTGACGGMHPYPCFDSSASHAPSGRQPGAADRRSHGSMVAFDATLVAPDVTLADLTMQSGETFLCDAYRHYSRLVPMMSRDLLARYKGVVLANAWYVRDASAAGAQTYINEPLHPVNRAITALDALGADIVFAAGNCGPVPANGCTASGATIYGANSHPSVLTVGAAPRNRWVKVSGLSSRGFGQSRLATQKPDLLAFTDFLGSVHRLAPNKPDTGTSAATGLAAGYVAAARAKLGPPTDPSSTPARLREYLRGRVEPCNGPNAWNKDEGAGLLSGDCGLK
jgi:hypothetical protein